MTNDRPSDAAPASPAPPAPAPEEPPPLQKPLFSFAFRPQHIVPTLLTLGVLAYVWSTTASRFERAFDPWVVEGDTKQTVWQFYRYFDPGSLPLGHLLTDYAWVYNAPPLYRAIMIPLSTVIDPITAGNYLHFILYLGAIAAAYWVCASRMGHIAGLAMVMIWTRTPSWHHTTAGGHARSFSPLLVMLFMGAWLNGHRRLCLLILIIQASVYPPPAMACSIAFGLWTLYRFARDRDWRPIVELAVAAVLIIGFAKSQDLLAQDWWGSPVWYKDVVRHGAFQRGSRMEFVPHEQVWSACWRYITTVFQPVGHNYIDGLSQWDRRHDFVLVLFPAGLTLLVATVWPSVKFPRQVLMLLLGGLLAFILARELAFKLHVPTRPIREAWIAAIPLAMVLSSFALLRRVLPRFPKTATALAALLCVAPVFVVHRDGLGKDEASPYSTNAHDAQLFEWVRANTPKDSLWAGSYRAMDLIGLFGWRVPFVNWTLAHPFRPGYWKEIERRTLTMYEAYYAVELQTVLDFAEKEHIQYLMIDRRNATSLYETRSQVRPFPPTAAPVRRMYDECHRKRCVLFDAAVKPAVVKVHRNWEILEVAKLRELAGTIPAWTPTAVKLGPELVDVPPAEEPEPAQPPNIDP